MNSSSRADAPQQQSNQDNDNVWEEQIKSEQLYNAFCRGSQRDKSNRSFMTDRASDIGLNIMQARIDTMADESFFNQSQGPTIQRHSMKHQHSNFAVITTNSVAAKQNMAADDQQFPDTISMSSQSSLDEPYFTKAESLQMEDQYKPLHKNCEQIEEANQARSQARKKTRKQLQDEINQLQFELLTYKETLNEANQRNEVLEKLLNQQLSEFSAKDQKVVPSSLELSNKSQNQSSHKKTLTVEVKSAKENETCSNMAEVEQQKLQSANLNDSVTEIKIQEAKTGVTDKKQLAVRTFEEEKEQEEQVTEQVAEQLKQM